MMMRLTIALGAALGAEAFVARPTPKYMAVTRRPAASQVRQGADRRAFGRRQRWRSPSAFEPDRARPRDRARAEPEVLPLT